jgi:uncharacterized phiE125 gp8 family phage protein
MNIKQLTYPTTLLISLDDAKDHLRVTDTNQDSVIKDCIKSATGLVEKYTGQILQSRTYCIYYDSHEIRRYEPIDIWMYPISSITSVKYLNESGVETTFSEYNTDLTSFPSRVLLTTTPTMQLDVLNQFRIYVTAGFTDVNEIDPEIIGWVKIFTAFFYQTRQPEYTGLTVNEIAYNYQRALDKYRVEPIV